MDARGLVRALETVGTVRGVRALRSAWRRRRLDAAALPRRGPERARVPGELRAVEPRPGGGVLRFARSSLEVRVATGGAVFCGWDGAGAEPSYALVGSGPPTDARAELEPDKDGGWRVVSERVTVVISRFGAVEFRTPGGLLLRRDHPPRWWEAVEPEDGRTAGASGRPDGGDGRPDGGDSRIDGGDGRIDGGTGARSPHRSVPERSVPARSLPEQPVPAQRGPGGGEQRAAEHRWMQRSEVAADARFFGLGAQPLGPRLPAGSYRLWHGAALPHRVGGPPPLAMPVQWVVADAGCHLVFHDNSWDGVVSLREGAEGAGSGHDRPGRCAVRMTGGPLRYWVLTGTPPRLLHGWATLTGAPTVPPRWALGYQHAHRGLADEREVRRLAADFRERGLPLRAVHLAPGGGRRRPRPWTSAPSPDPTTARRLAAELRADGVRLVSLVAPGVPARPGLPVYDGGVAAGAFVRDAWGRPVRGVTGSGEVRWPDFTDPRARTWWAGRYEERLTLGFQGVWHDSAEPVSPDQRRQGALPRSARHAMEGRGGDHREAHNVHPLAMNRAGHEALRAVRPDRRPLLVSCSGWAGTQRYGGLCSGEAEASWEGLRASLALVLGAGLCGVPYAGADVGGCVGSLSPELYLRWFQLGAYLPLFRTQTACRSARREPWEFGPQVLEHAGAALRERERLLPYLTTLAQLARRTGAPWVRPLWWHAPKDRALRDCADAFLLGDALLVAPVLEPGATARSVRLPRGHWYETASGRVHRGPGRVTLDAPRSAVPVLARAGAVVPVTGADGGTELEVWAPSRGRTGGGLLVADRGEGWARTEVERFTVRLLGDRPTVTRDGGAEVGYPVRVRGSGA